MTPTERREALIKMRPYLLARALIDQRAERSHNRRLANEAADRAPERSRPQTDSRNAPR